MLRVTDVFIIFTHIYEKRCVWLLAHEYVNVGFQSACILLEQQTFGYQICNFEEMRDAICFY